MESDIRNQELIQKLAIGTAQFGLNYGISNNSGKTSLAEVHKILKNLTSHGIDVLDTAVGYGNSEDVLGQVRACDHFQIISKLPAQIQPSKVEQTIQQSLKRLNTSQLQGLLIHDVQSFKSNGHAIYESLMASKENKLVSKIGFSLYHTADLDYLFNHNFRFDIVQLPYNVLDQRFEPYFERLKKYDSEIHVRSAFLQGLFFLDPLPPYFNELKTCFKQLAEIEDKHGLRKTALLVLFALLNPLVDKVVIGVNNNDQLNENLTAIQEIQKDTFPMNKLKSLKNENLKMILPINWPK